MLVDEYCVERKATLVHKLLTPEPHDVLHIKVIAVQFRCISCQLLLLLLVSETQDFDSHLAWVNTLI